MIKKIAGKIVSYLGLLTAIDGIINESLVGLYIGIFFICLGCLIHELNET